MLTPAVVRSASGAASYYAADNYYTDGQATEASLWTGSGADALGLTGTVTQDRFEAVLSGLLPDGSSIPTGPGGKHRPGLDFTFSAPKSLSLLAYVGGDTRLLVAHMTAVKASIGWMETNLAETRVARNGTQTVVATGNLMVALFQHDTSRALDPQAHIHAVIANATRGPDGQWRALHNDALWKGYTAAASVYNATLCQAVEALGYETERVAKHGQFEIAGVPRALIETFSTRSAEIDAAMAAMVHQTPEARSAVTLSTRAAKLEQVDRAVLRGDWSDRARASGFDLTAMVQAATVRAQAEPSPWQRLVTGVRGVGAQVLALVERLGLGGGPRPDPFVPERAGRLAPDAYAAAQAVASAVRHLADREAAFPARDLLKAALDLGAPVAVADVEQRIGQLVGRGLLMTGADGTMMTTAQALATEHAIIAGVMAGKGAVTPVLAGEDAGARVQAAASGQGRRLNAGQLTAAVAILSSRDRVVAVQGVAGAGKSAMLKPVVAIAQAEGRTVLGLAVQNTVARRLGADTGVVTQTVAAFLRSHDGLGRTAADDAVSRVTLGGTVLVVDEASMFGNDAMRRLIDVANRHGVGRLALVGDRRQLGAVEAGKPFAVVQRAGAATAVMPQNLRATTDAMRAIHAAAQSGQVRELMTLLAPHTREAPGRGAKTAAAMWMALPPSERDRTGIYVSGRQLRAAVNDEVQHLRLAAGELGHTHVRIMVLDPVNLTREEERLAEHYRPGRIVEFARGVPSQGIAAGWAVVTATERGVVGLRRRDGGALMFRPGRLAPNRVDGSVRIHERRSMTFHAGDQLRWTATDHARGLVNADTATLAAVRTDALVIRTRDGRDVELARGDPMLMRLDLAYAASAHAAQGATSDRGILVADSREGRLITTSLMRVLVTRVREGVTLVVDDGARLERAAGARAGEKAAAVDVVERNGRRSSSSQAIGANLPEKALEIGGPGDGGRARGIEFEL